MVEKCFIRGFKVICIRAYFYLVKCFAVLLDNFGQVCPGKAKSSRLVLKFAVIEEG